MPDTAASRSSVNIEDLAALLAYLRTTGRIGRGEVPEITVLAGGVSNRTVRVKRASGEAWVLKQALAKLRVPTDWFSSPERIRREAQGLELLRELLPHGSVPDLVFRDDAQYVFAMTAVPEPHANWKDLVLGGQINMDDFRQFGAMLGRMHSESHRRLSCLPSELGDRSYFDSLRLDPYYRFTARQVPESAPFLMRLIDETLSEQSAIVHGDYSPKNILIHNGQLVLLDHEVIHIGDPAFDVGFSLTHLVSKAHHLHSRRRQIADGIGVYWHAYVSAHPRIDEARGVRHTLGCLLARVEGKSRLEYLSPEERVRQRRVSLALMGEPPSRVADLVSRFLKEISRCESKI